MSAAWPGHEPGSAAYRRITLALFAAGFAVFALVFGPQALLPAISDDLGIGASDAALVVSATTLGVAASVLPWAWLADRIGRVAAMRVSLVAAVVIAVAAPLLPTLEGVVAARLLLGLAVGAVPAVSVAYLAEELVASRVAVAAGLFVAGNTFGGIAGRILGALLAEPLGWRTSMLITGGLALLAALAFLLLVPRPLGSPGAGEQAHPLAVRIVAQLRDPVMLALYAQGLLLMGAFGAVYNLLAYRLQAPPLLVPASLAGLAFAAYLFGTGASRLSGTLVGRFGPLRVILLGIGLMIAGLLLLLPPSLPSALIGLVVFTIGCFTAHPTASGQSGVRARIGRAQATALYQLAWLGGTALCGWLAGLVYDGAGWGAAIAMLLAQCAVAALAAVVGLRVLADRRPPLPPITGKP